MKIMLVVILVKWFWLNIIVVNYLYFSAELSNYMLYYAA